MFDHNDGQERKPTILVVDDTPDSLRFLTTTLSLAHMTPLVARDGLAAITLLQHTSPDLILMDALMPKMDGFETTRRIKANSAFQQLPIIFMTGLTDTDDVVRALKVGAIDYVRKPIVVEELLARIHIHLANARVTHASQVALDTSGRPALSVDASGRPLWLTPMAREILERLFPEWPAISRALPAPLRLAIQQLQEMDPTSGTCVPVKSGSSTLEITLLRRTSAHHWLFRLAERREGEEERILAARLGLTAREAEVLLWISRGKQNREVSEILAISPRTVNKHLEQIFEKMGVENRASATAIAVTTLAD
ncbi:DNA-binding response regulator [Novosphingobium sp. BL-8A]|uniref:response regulator n=1 Tax=Novosphingobium sp. BL-8A TaxID=3127639 RepID=UPI003756C192